eukprot:TRINITY_DN45749_c0_g1_i1.p1 TRINITY_DN45749_c0_g1~~TRINITY_DN45749_c0_g1_i1.p1  ORF type:complete len:383 (-),score=61.21 TRINITY_DN45749_c0_g1_i1:209-1276(-)
MTALDELKSGDRVRVAGGRNYEKFHGGMEGTIIANNLDSRNMTVQFDDVNTAGTEPLSVAYRHLEHAPSRGGYRAGSAPAPGAGGPPGSEAPKEPPKGPLLDEHGEFKTRILVQLHGLQGAQELNGKLGRLRKYDVNAERWEVDVREHGIKRLKEENLGPPPEPEVPSGLSVEELKARGNDCFKKIDFEHAVAYYTAAIDLIEDDKADPKPAEAEDPKYQSVLYGNRAQCYINLCREINGEDRHISRECRSCAMRANMDAAQAIELDPLNGKAYYRRGCAVLGMAPSASRAKEAIHYLEVALTGRASGGKDGMVLPNAMRNEVTNLLDYAKRRLDACVEAAVPDVEQCRQNCKQQ